MTVYKKGSLLLKAFKSYSPKLEIDLDLETDLDLDPMTLIYEHDLGIFRIYLYTKNKICCSRLSKVIG